ncbi:MAG: molybdenum cofactor guanylyltransferase [Eubacteriales bacterium]|nr:molybdenum cofactor guanylyltransferase [Eubacteriales bacterium]
MKAVPEELSMLILAGGLSSRMGSDKCDLMYHGKTFLENQIEKGRRLGIRDILVSGYRGESCSSRIIPDRHRQCGPLGGLEASLREAQNKKCLVLGVDIPLVSVQELHRLLKASEDDTHAAILLQHGERLEPLIGVYRTELADAMEQALLTGNGSIMSFLRKTGYGVYKSSADEQYFENVNDRRAYARLL